jgi:purine-binding chemotaxis protein CheW
VSSAATAEPGASRSAILEALRANEREHLRLRAGLVAFGPGQRLPGSYLLVGVDGGRVLLPGARVAEVALRVAFDPVPGGPPWLRGSFLWRGRPALAADLGARLGGAACTVRDAMLVVLDGEPTVALLVDKVHRLVEHPLLADAAEGAGPAARLFLGSCSVEAETIPLLAPEVLERDAREAG